MSSPSTLSKVTCESCGYEAEGITECKVTFARSLAEVALQRPACGKPSLVPATYIPDLLVSRSHKVVIEVYREKSSVKDAAKIEAFGTNGFTAVTVPNAAAADAEWPKPIFQLLALICGADHPERL